MKSKPKSKVPKRIKFADKLFQGLYELGSKLYDHYKLRPELFKQLTDHRSNAVHALGMFIVQRRYSRAKTMVHESTEGEFMSLMNNDRYEHVDMFYFLPQRDVLGFALSKWSGTTLKDKMKYTDDDKIRVVGIALSEDMKDHLKYLLNGSDRKGRLTIDQWRGQQRVAYTLLHQKFIDYEVKITLPDAWSSEETKDEVERCLGDGWYEKFSFDPNNRSRIELPWDLNGVKGILSKVLLEYKQGVLVEDLARTHHMFFGINARTMTLLGMSVANCTSPSIISGTRH